MPPRGDTQSRVGLCTPGLAQGLPEQATESRHHPSPRGAAGTIQFTLARSVAPPQPQARPMACDASNTELSAG